MTKRCKSFPAICEEHGTIVQNSNGVAFHRKAMNCWATFLPLFSKSKRTQDKIKAIKTSSLFRIKED